MYDELKILMERCCCVPGAMIQLPADGDEIWIELPGMPSNGVIFQIDDDAEFFELYLACFDIDVLKIQIYINGNITRKTVTLFGVEKTADLGEVNQHLRDHLENLLADTKIINNEHIRCVVI